MKVFFDMDGTLARFYDDPNALDRMWEPGYFKGLKPYQNMIDAIKKLNTVPGLELYILSATTTENEYSEKFEWINKYLPGIFGYHQIGFVSPRTVKAEHVKAKFGDDLAKAILIDDYNKNLNAWKEHGGTAVKFVNEINDKGTNGPLWPGERVSFTDTVDDIVDKIMAIAFSSPAEVVFDVTFTRKERIKVEVPADMVQNADQLMAYLQSLDLKTLISSEGDNITIQTDSVAVL